MRGWAQCVQSAVGYRNVGRRSVPRRSRPPVRQIIACNGGYQLYNDYDNGHYVAYDPDQARPMHAIACGSDRLGQTRTTATGNYAAP